MEGFQRHWTKKLRKNNNAVPVNCNVHTKENNPELIEAIEANYLRVPDPVHDGKFCFERKRKYFRFSHMQLIPVLKTRRHVAAY